jgi:hypothetical protein
MLYACKGAHTLFTGQRKRKRKGEREGQKGEKVRESEKVGRERKYLFLKAMTGALAPFTYLVCK